MAKAVDLLSYWIPFLRQLKEFKEIAKAEEPEIRYLLEAIDRTLGNMFIETADEYGIKRFEDMMKIYPEDGDTLETRRFKVKSKWSDSAVYTDEELYNRLLSLCGSADKFSITEHYKDYWIEITTSLGIVGAFDAVVDLLEEMLPCNLVLVLSNLIRSTSTATLTAGGVANTAMSYLITNDIDEKFISENTLYYGAGVSAGTHTVVDSGTATVLISE